MFLWNWNSILFRSGNGGRISLVGVNRSTAVLVFSASSALVECLLVCVLCDSLLSVPCRVVLALSPQPSLPTSQGLSLHLLFSTRSTHFVRNK